jgi:uncharacterized iron-regulated membrane protein
MLLLQRLLILLHRYLGIPLSFVFVLWFVSGIAMIYAGGMPQLTPAMRIDHLPPLELARAAIAPSVAAAAAGGTFERAQLATVLDRPAYRFASPFGATTVFADDGTVLNAIGIDEAQRVASRYLGVNEDLIRFVRTVSQPDQWTLVLGRDLPLHKFAVDDDARTEVYVSPALAEVRLVTTRGSRALAWAGTIPHWLYFTPLRTNQPLWYWTVVVLAGLGCVLAAAGIVLAVTQFRRTKPFKLSAAIRYTGWLRWHYVSGALFGVFALTWVFSGLLSMEPFDWTSADGAFVDREAFSGGPADLQQFPPFDAARWNELAAGRTLKEIELANIQDRPYYVARYVEAGADARRERLHQPYRVTGRNEPHRLLIAADTLEVRASAFSTESLLERLRSAAPDAAVVESELLTEYDSYYYSRGGQAPLPVLRAKLADPLETWVYVDPEMSEVVAVIHRLNRVERWLYNGLHSLDFSFWYGRRPLWDVGMIALSLGALATSLIGLYLGVKRVRRDIGRLVRRGANAETRAA